MKTDLERFARRRPECMKKRITSLLLALIVLLSTLACGCGKISALLPDRLFPDGYFNSEKETVVSFFSSFGKEAKETTDDVSFVKDSAESLSGSLLTLNGEDVPLFDGETASVQLNQNKPLFASKDFSDTFYESYSPLDSLGRAGAAMACLDVSKMPQTERSDITYPHTSGYINRRYAFIDDGHYLYNHCHLIGYQLTGQTDNIQNLITGTRFMNVEGMLPYENLIANYLRDTGNRVLYRVTPVYIGDELVARGVEMEAMSVEDDGRGLCFHVFCYNVQAGVTIDYATGGNYADGTK